MAWGKPKRNIRCPRPECRRRGQCSCQRRINEDARRNPQNQPRPCPVKLPNGKICGKTMRGGVCPSSDH